MKTEIIDNTPNSHEVIFRNYHPKLAVKIIVSQKPYNWRHECSLDMIEYQTKAHRMITNPHGQHFFLKPKEEESKKIEKEEKEEEENVEKEKPSAPNVQVGDVVMEELETKEALIVRLVKGLKTCLCCCGLLGKLRGCCCKPTTLKMLTVTKTHNVFSHTAEDKFAEKPLEAPEGGKKASAWMAVIPPKSYFVMPWDQYFKNVRFQKNLSMTVVSWTDDKDTKPYVLQGNLPIPPEFNKMTLDILQGAMYRVNAIDNIYSDIAVGLKFYGNSSEFTNDRKFGAYNDSFEDAKARTFLN